MVRTAPAEASSTSTSRMALARACRSAAVRPVLAPFTVMMGVWAVRLTWFTYRRSATSMRLRRSSWDMSTLFPMPSTLSLMLLTSAATFSQSVPLDREVDSFSTKASMSNSSIFRPRPLPISWPLLQASA